MRQSEQRNTKIYCSLTFLSFLINITPRFESYVKRNVLKDK